MVYIMTTKEEIKTKIHTIHNFMRNNGFGYGFDALKLFVLLYGLKMIEPLIKKKIIQFESNNECFKFSHLIKLANNKDDNNLWNKFYNDVLDGLSRHELLRDILFYEIPKDIKVVKFRELILLIDTINISDNFHLAGKIYEYFIGREDTAISSLGAYYTDRWITKYVINKINIKLDKDNKIPVFCDPFGGSGGFTLSYIEYLNKISKDINWNTEIKNIYHTDINQDVIKMVKLEMFVLTHEFTTRDYVYKTNSFTDTFRDKKFDIILSNPPYGGDKKDEKLKITECSPLIINKAMAGLERSKWKMDSANKTIKNIVIKGDSKENASMLLFLNLLNKNGKLGVVIKEGLLFDKKYKALRQEMVDNYNIKYIIDVPQNAFENTSTKTSIIILENTGKTTNIEFLKLNVSKNKAGDILDVTDEPIIKTSYTNIVAKNYSLNYKQYVETTIKCSDDFENIKLGDLIEFLPKSKRPASDGKESGLYKFYTSSDTPQQTDMIDYNDDNGIIIIGTGGNGSLHFDKQFSCSADNFLFRSKDNTKLPSKYIFCALQIYKENLLKLMHGSTIKHLSKDSLINFMIPVPKDYEKYDEHVDMTDNCYFLIRYTKDVLRGTEKFIQHEIRLMCEDNDCDEFLLKDVCEIQTGTRITKNKDEVAEDFIGEKYPVYGGGDITFYTNKYNREGLTLLISRFGISKKCVRLVKGKIFLNDSSLSIKTNNPDYEKYLHYYLLLKNNMIYKLATGSCQLNLNPTTLKSLQIKIPKNKKLLNELDNQILLANTARTNIEIFEIKYKKYLNTLQKHIEGE
jgi:type I restriction-modification system DNA methylase subunit